MDFGQMLADSYEYTREAVWGKWVKWILLIISCIIFPLIMGYGMEIMRGKKPAPELENWGKLFIDGIKLLIVGLIYAIPLIIIEFLLIGGSMVALSSGDPTVMMAAIGGMIAGLLVVFIVAIIIALFATMGYIRFARTDQFGEAFNFNAILAHIGKIGWVSYIIALIIVYVVIGVIIFILMLIPVIGAIIQLILIPAFAIFTIRYITLLYDSVPS